jgi:hypothetical protein
MKNSAKQMKINLSSDPEILAKILKYLPINKALECNLLNKNFYNEVIPKSMF